MTISNSNANNSNLLTHAKKFIVWMPLIIGVSILIPLFLHICGLIEISSSLSLIVEYGPLFTFSAMLFLVSVTAYYSYATKKIADSTETNVEITKRTIETMKQTMWHQALLDVKKDYRSAEMMSALNELWKFYRGCKKKADLKKEFKKRYKKEKAEISKDNMKTEESLNYKRRLITHFYIHLASIYKHGILPPDMIFDWWLPSDLKMIKKFIIPLQEALSEIHKIPKKEIEYVMQPLIELKNAGEAYFKEKSSN